MENIDKNMCDSVRELIFSDEILSDEQKKHINNCECCSKLLLQKKTLLSDLAEFDLIENKDAFCAGVVEKISTPHRTKGISFKASRYAAMAAAAVVVFASIFLLQNKAGLSENDNGIAPITLKNQTTADDAFDFTQNTAKDSKESDDFEHSFENEIQEDVPSDTAEPLQDAPKEEARTMLKMARPEKTAADQETTTLADEPVQEENIKYNLAITDFAQEDDAVLFSSEQAEDGAPVSSDNSEAEASSGGGGGASGAVKTEEESFFEESVNDVLFDEAECENEESLPFCDVEFLDGKENLEYNLALLQQKLDEIYGQKYTVDTGAFINAGHNNSMFTEIIKHMTQNEFFEFIKSSSTFVYEK